MCSTVPCGDAFFRRHQYFNVLLLYLICSIIINNTFIFLHICLFSAAIPITIGMRQSLYYINEDAGALTVCYEVLSGRTADRSINMQLRTVEGDAKGILVHTPLLVGYIWILIGQPYN